MSSVGVDNISSKGGGDRPPVEVMGFIFHRSPRFGIFLLFALKPRHFVTENSRYYTITKDNHQ